MKNTNNTKYSASSSNSSEIDETNSNLATPNNFRDWPVCSCSCSDCHCTTDHFNPSHSGSKCKVCVYRWVWITYYKHILGNNNNELKLGDYAATDVRPDGSSSFKRVYYPNGSHVHEYGQFEQTGTIEDSGDGGRVLTMPGTETLPYASWLDRYTDNLAYVNKGPEQRAYWAKVLICWDWETWPCFMPSIPKGTRCYDSVQAAEADIAAGRWAPSGLNGETSETPPANVPDEK